MAALVVALATAGCSKNESVLQEDEVPTQPGLGPAERQRTSAERLGGVFSDEVAQFRRQTRDELQLVVRRIESLEERVEADQERVRHHVREYADNLSARAEGLRLRLQAFEADTEAEFREEKARIEAELRRLEDDVGGLDLDDDAT